MAPTSFAQGASGQISKEQYQRQILAAVRSGAITAEEGSNRMAAFVMQQQIAAGADPIAAAKAARDEDVLGFVDEEGGAFSGMGVLETLAGAPPDPAPWKKHNYAGTPAAYRTELQRMGAISPEVLEAMNAQSQARGEQQAGLDMLRRIATGEESAVRPELAAARDRLQRQALSQVASARGANRLAALRGGMQASGDAQASLGAQGAAALAQERLAGMGAFSSAANALRGGDLGALGAMTQGELGRKSAYQGMFDTGLKDKAYQSALDVGYAEKVAGQKQRNAEIAYQAEQNSDASSGRGWDQAAGILGGVGGFAAGLGSLFSDVRMKTSIAPSPDAASTLERGSDPYALDPSRTPNLLPPEVRASLEQHAALSRKAPDGSWMTQDRVDGIGAMAGGLGQLLGAFRPQQQEPMEFGVSPSPFPMFSDERAKAKASPTTAIDDLLEHLRPYEYEYKPGMGPPGRRHGVMAQDLAQSEAGREAVVRDPATGMLAIDIPSATSVSLAALADLGQRVKKLEGR